MFLFTDTAVGTRETGQAVRAGGAKAEVVDAIRDGARSTGTSFDYLLATAQRESGLDARAKASTSSASGLFQFIEQTWLGVMKTTGPRLGLTAYADAITARADGTYGVADAATRQAILDLRGDARVSSAMAGALTQRNRDALSAAIGREPTDGDLYAAHVLGARGAAGLIASAQADPERPAHLDMPEAAAANRALFYERTGRARSASDLYALLSRHATGERTPASESASTASDRAAAAPRPEGGLIGFFQTDLRQGAVSPGVARLWENRSASLGGRGGPPAPSYFPRTETVPAAVEDRGSDPAEAVSPVSAEPAQPVVVPLPPRRPNGLVPGEAASGSAAATHAARSAWISDRSAPSLAYRNGP